jgi:hypothetical protein
MDEAPAALAANFDKKISSLSNSSGLVMSQLQLKRVEEGRFPQTTLRQKNM